MISGAKPLSLTDQFRQLGFPRLPRARCPKTRFSTLWLYSTMHYNAPAKLAVTVGWCLDQKKKQSKWWRLVYYKLWYHWGITEAPQYVLFFNNHIIISLRWRAEAKVLKASGSSISRDITIPSTVANHAGIPEDNFSLSTNLSASVLLHRWTAPVSCSPIVLVRLL